MATISKPFAASKYAGSPRCRKCVICGLACMIEDVIRTQSFEAYRSAWYGRSHSIWRILFSPLLHYRRSIRILTFSRVILALRSDFDFRLSALQAYVGRALNQIKPRGCSEVRGWEGLIFDPGSLRFIKRPWRWISPWRRHSVEMASYGVCSTMEAHRSCRHWPCDAIPVDCMMFENGVGCSMKKPFFVQQT